ncbi:MAG: MHYT domain-containing protein [Cyanobacteria bacterium J06560_5]
MTMASELPTGHNLPLVGLSILIAMLAAYTALELAGRVTANKGRSQVLWLTGGALAMGIGIWAMHFVGMLAFRLPFAVEYDFLIVVASMVPAVVVSGLALFLVSRPTFGPFRWLSGSLLMGGGISAMHYVGMTAMKTTAHMHYTVSTVALSVGIAIAVSFVGLHLVFRLRDETADNHGLKKILAALVIGSAIPIMHYTGMNAVHFIPASGRVPATALQPPNQAAPLVISVVIGTLTLFVMTWLSTFLDRRLSAQASYTQDLEKSQDKLKTSERTYRALAKQKSLLNDLSTKIRQSLDLEETLQTTVYEVRRFFSSDRALIYQFDKNWCGSVTIEETAEPWPATLNEAADDCFPTSYLDAYRNGRIQKINNVLDAGLSPEHLTFLQRLQVKANLMVPIMVQDQLWGLLIVHQCDQPRVWTEEEGDLLYRLAIQLGLAIQQADLYALAEANALQALAQAQQLRVSETKLKQQTQSLTQTLQEVQSLQMQLVQSEKMSSLGQLVAGIAHEINNPVNFIHGNLNHIQRYAQDLMDLMAQYQQHYPEPNQSLQAEIEDIDPEFLQADLTKMLASMRVGTDRIREIVLSLRTFSRMDESGLKLADINKGIDSTLMILQHRLKEAPQAPAIDIIRDYAPLPQVNCYPGQLNQVMMNILANAIDALESVSATRSLTENQQNPGKITIRTAVVGDDWVEITIADNGPGIPDAVQARIFDPFFTTKPIGKGTGMGMSISYKIIVEKHGGKLTCFSNPEQGTEFLVRIPLMLSDSTPSDLTLSNPARSGLACSGPALSKS